MRKINWKFILHMFLLVLFLVCLALLTSCSKPLTGQIQSKSYEERTCTTTVVYNAALKMPMPQTTCSGPYHYWYVCGVNADGEQECRNCSVYDTHTWVAYGIGSTVTCK